MWYDKLTDEQIQQMKENLAEHDKLKTELNYAFRDAPRDALLWLEADGTWGTVNNPSRRAEVIYRLRPDWVRPEKKAEWEEVVVGVVKTIDGMAFCERNSSFIGSPYFVYMGKMYHQAGFIYDVGRGEFEASQPILWINTTNGTSAIKTHNYLTPIYPIKVRGVRRVM